MHRRAWPTPRSRSYDGLVNSGLAKANDHESLTSCAQAMRVLEARTHSARKRDWRVRIGGSAKSRLDVKWLRGVTVELQSPSTHVDVSAIDFAASVIILHTSLHLLSSSENPSLSYEESIPWARTRQQRTL